MLVCVMMVVTLGPVLPRFIATVHSELIEGNFIHSCMLSDERIITCASTGGCHHFVHIFQHIQLTQDGGKTGTSSVGTNAGNHTPPRTASETIESKATSEEIYLSVMGS